MKLKKRYAPFYTEWYDMEGSIIMANEKQAASVL
jgi:hypothetical protein